MVVLQPFKGFGTDVPSDIQVPPTPYGALPKICLSSMRYMQGDFLLLSGNEADVREQIRHEVSVCSCARHQ